MADHDIPAINQLVFRYAQALDTCDVTGFLASFTPDGRLRSYHPDTDEPFADLSGHEQLCTIPEAMQRMFRQTVHMVTNHLVDVQGDEASGTALCTARYLGTDPVVPAALIVMVRLIDRYARQDGRWRIADRQIRFLWSERHDVVDSGFPI